MKKLNSVERKKLIRDFKYNINNFIKDYNDIYLDEKDSICKYIEKPLKKFYGILAAVRDTNPEKYYYIYKTPDNKLGYLTKPVYLKWLSHNKDEMIKRNKGFRVLFSKFIKRMPFFARWVERDGSIHIKSKFILNEIHLSSEETENYLNLICDRLRNAFELDIKPIGDGWSLENWVKAYSIDLDDSWSNIQAASISCMRAQAIGTSECRERNKFHEIISNKGKNCQIYGIYFGEDIVGRFKVWFWKDKKLVDRIYCKYAYVHQAIEQINANKEFTCFRDCLEKEKIFKNIEYIYDKNLFSNIKIIYMDTMSYLITKRGNDNQIFLCHDYHNCNINYIDLVINLKTTSSSFIFKACKVCGKLINYNDYNEVCEECNYKYCNTLTKDGFKYLKKEDVFYLKIYNGVSYAYDKEMCMKKVKLYIESLNILSSRKDTLLNYLGEN